MASRRSGCLLMVAGLAAVLPGAAASGGGFPADGVTLLSHLDLDDFPTPQNRGNDCWGYVSPSGREYALMGLFGELAVVEVSSPSAPVVIAEIAHAASNWSDVKVYQDHAYVVNEEGGGMDVIDLSQVDAGIVTLVQTVTEPGLQTSHNVAVDTTSGFLYLCGSNINGGRLVAFDLADPASPVVAGQIPDPVGADVHDAQIVTYTSGPYAGKQIAFAAAGGTGVDIYDVTDKSNMVRLSRTTYPNLSFSHQCWASEDRQYLYVNDELDNVNETVILDISDLEKPSVAGTYNSGVAAIDHNLYVHQGFIYEAEYTAGLRIFDASDPLNPVQVGWFDTYPDSDAAATTGAWSNYPFFPSGIVLISTKDAGLFVVRPGPPPLLFNYPVGPPSALNPAGDSFLVEIQAQDGETLDPASPVLHYDVGAGFVDVAMVQQGPGVYEASFPALACPQLVPYFVSATTASMITLNDPLSAPTPTFSAIVGNSVDVVFDDDMEQDNGWSAGVGGDTANEGLWTRVDPIGTGSQPENDHTADPGTLCFVTGQGPPNGNDGDNDVDGGRTTLLSPLLSLGDADDAVISYWRWYANDFFLVDADEGNAPNEDVFVIEITNDGGTHWVPVETIGPDGPETSGGWVQHAFNVADVIPPTDQIRLRFVASDSGSLSVVEAAVDDFQVAVVCCDGAGLGDLNDDGAVNAADLALLLGSWGGCPACPADLNADESVDAADLALLLGNWGGCG